MAEQEIDLSDKTVTMGDIYTGLVKCLYKIYTERTRIAYKADNFKKVMKSVGQLALQTLMSNNPLLQRSEVLRIVGEFAFEYGLYAGHEDIRLLGDPTADIYVTYLHRSLEEFFGSYGFIQALNEGQSIDDILGSECEEPIFMVNILVFRFCLWFSSSSDFDLPHREECCDKLTSYVAKRIDSQVFDPISLEEKYPALNMLLPNAALDYSTVRQFFHDTLNKCKHVRIMKLRGHSIFLHHADQFFGLMKKNLIDKLTTITLGGDVFKLTDTDNNSVTLSMVTDYGVKLINLLLQKYNLAHRNPHIYLKNIINGETKWDITPLLFKHFKELHIANRNLDSASITASAELPHCPILTNLTIKELHIDDSIPAVLGRAIQSGKFPSLPRITLKRCCGATFSSDWPIEVNVLSKRDTKYCRICSNPIKVYAS